MNCGPENERTIVSARGDVVTVSYSAVTDSFVCRTYDVNGAETFAVWTAADVGLLREALRELGELAPRRRSHA